jgi:hypothetical protein
MENLGNKFSPLSGVAGHSCSGLRRARGRVERKFSFAESLTLSGKKHPGSHKGCPYTSGERIDKKGHPVYENKPGIEKTLFS